MARSYLALGDSYTIGEGVELRFSFPYQLVLILRKHNLPFFAPEIIAKTGWTTDELGMAIDSTPLLPVYDVVSLLIGVNDQYRGRHVDEFRVGFEQLLQKSIQLTGNQPSNVFVLSIPDWGVTPFAGSRDPEKIMREINEFNSICKSYATRYNASYINITEGQRSDGADPEFLAADGLHPSGKEYAKWAIEIDRQLTANWK